MDIGKTVKRCVSSSSLPSPTSRFRRAVFVTLASACIGFLASSCSSGSPSNGVADVGSKTTTTTGASSGKGSTLDYSKCMQTHGVPDFPDPSSNGVIRVSGNSSNGLDPQSPAFQRAQNECKSDLPSSNATPSQQAQSEAQLLKYSECMRAHGVLDFPDPNSKGQISLSYHGSAGSGSSSDLNPNSPVFQKAQSTCSKELPGSPPGLGPTTSHGNGGSDGGFSMVVG